MSEPSAIAATPEWSERPSSPAAPGHRLAVIIISRAIRYLASPEFLILCYTFSILLSFKPLVYGPLIASLWGMKWRISFQRLVYYGLFAGATALFFVTPDNINATGAFLLVALGLFSSANAPRRVHIENKITVYLIVFTLFAFFAFSNVFDVNEGVVSRNFIPIIGLYTLVTALAWKRLEIALLAVVLAILVFAAGSRSGTAVFLLLSALIVSRPLTIVLVGIVALVYFIGPNIEVMPSQFERGYETEADPRLFIWAEFVNDAMAGTLFRRESFVFMDTFSLERNFHNSVLEAYYRLGPVALLLLLLHFRLLKNTRHEAIAFSIFAALLIKAIFDTYLWFTPIDLILFREYGSRVLGLKDEKPAPRLPASAPS